MSSFNGIPPLWDLALPNPLPALNDDDFLALLQKPYNPAAATNPVPVGQTLPDVTPPLSEDSSPSPPGSVNDTADARKELPKPGVRTRAASGHRPQTHDDDVHKRKATYEDDDDDDDPAPARKASRRKSTSAVGDKDESRLIKRKEQNRAAQRAFRERKEKHVKDLEDKVAALEAKTNTQAAENQNLRDLLIRLQNENQMLKQSAFTFSFPTGSSSTSGTTPSTSNNAAGSSSVNLATSPQSATSPFSLFNVSQPRNATVSPPVPDPTPPATFDNASFMESFGAFINTPSSTSSSSNNGNNNQTAVTPITPQTPYTTIASNPMFMSFTDPSMNPFTSFGGWGGGPLPAMEDVSMSSFDNFTGNDNQLLEQLFGSQYDSLIPFSNDFDISNPNAITNGLSPSNVLAGVSPVAHQEPTPGGEHKQCPRTKEEAQAVIAMAGPSSFTVESPFPSMSDSMSFGLSPAPALSSASSVAGPSNKPSPCSKEDLAMTAEECQVLPKTTKNASNIPLDEAWQHIQKHPSFSDFDLDQLCAELKAKASCDGEKKVVEPKKVLDLMHSLSERAQKKM